MPVLVLRNSFFFSPPSLQVSHIYICDYHKNVIHNVRSKRKRKDSEDDRGSLEGDEEIPEVNLIKLLFIYCLTLLLII